MGEVAERTVRGDVVERCRVVDGVLAVVARPLASTWRRPAAHVGLEVARDPAVYDRGLLCGRQWRRRSDLVARLTANQHQIVDGKTHGHVAESAFQYELVIVAASRQCDARQLPTISFKAKLLFVSKKID